MALGVTEAKIAISLQAVEASAKDLGTAKLTHLIALALTLVDGTTDGTQVNRVWSDSGSVAAGVPVEIDLLGLLTSQLDGSTVSFVDMVGVFIKILTGSGNLEIGAGSNPWITWLKATGDAVVITGANAVFVWLCPNGKAPTATTGDILTLTSSSGTITYEIAIIGRSA